MRSVVIIPARYKSSRYPGKPLVKLLGKSMILWVAELSAKALGSGNVYVATDDERISETVERAGFQAIMTGEARNGTERLAHAARQVEADIYINVQGDEPLVDPHDIERVRDAKQARPDCVVNGFSWISEQEEPANVNIPKVIANEQNEMVYMSRLPLPGYKEVGNAPQRYRKQVCIYAFSRSELDAYASFGRKSALEHCEDIEILRFLELGTRVLMIETRPGSLAVDSPEDVPGVEVALEKAGHHAG
ncbi:MAG: 3-deoxy-manno-octulosonate cytidylyltransferase [Pseudomonadota bacterium]